MPTPSVADLTLEFVGLNHQVKGGHATVVETERWNELRRMLMVAQMQPVPDARDPAPLLPLDGGRRLR